jgi:hypothetical protein
MVIGGQDITIVQHIILGVNMLSSKMESIYEFYEFYDQYALVNKN